MFAIRGFHRTVPVLVLLTMQIVFAPPSNATPGDLDPSFGQGGWVVTPFGGQPFVSASALAIQSDERILVAGTAFRKFTIVRYLPDGTLDPSFGEDGNVRTAFKAGRSDPFALAIQPDGRVVVAGHAGNRMAVARYLPDGSLDPDFGGGDGKVIVRFPTAASALEIEILPDGGILIAGPGGYPWLKTGLALARLTEQGGLDETFGVGGTASCGTGRFGVGDVAFDETTVVAVGARRGRFVVARCRFDGTLDASFGSRGVRRYELGSPSYTDINSTNVVLDDAGRILVAVQGHSDPQAMPPPGDPLYSFSAAIRLTADGHWDPSFSGDGVAFPDAHPDGVGAIGIQQDGKIVLVGGVMVGGGSGEDNCLFARFATDGTQDLTFGDGGSITIPGPGGVPGLTFPCRALATQRDGKLLSLSSYYDNSMRVIRVLAA